MNRHARQLFYFGWGNLAPVFNPLAQAVAILTKYGGSLWLADPAYTFTGSDGTGAAGDNSDTGYVRDLCGNARPLTQATTGFKPKLRRLSDRWVWVFDGVDDGLATSMQPASSAETLIVCADVSADIPNLGERIQKIDSLGGLRIYGDSSPFYAFHRTATGEGFTPLGTAANLRGVATFSCGPTLQKTRMNGSNFAQKNTAYVSTSQPVTLGTGPFGASGISVFAAAYIPGVPSDAELLIVEKAMAQLAGVTI